MLVLIVLLVSWLVFRAVGAAGVHALASWQDSARYALVVMFIFTATAHFNKMKHDLAQMIPPGVLELLGAKAYGIRRTEPIEARARETDYEADSLRS